MPCDKFVFFEMTTSLDKTMTDKLNRRDFAKATGAAAAVAAGGASFLSSNSALAAAPAAAAPVALAKSRRFSLSAMVFSVLVDIHCYVKLLDDLRLKFILKFAELLKSLTFGFRCEVVRVAQLRDFCDANTIVVAHASKLRAAEIKRVNLGLTLGETLSNKSSHAELPRRNPIGRA